MDSYEYVLSKFRDQGLVIVEKGDRAVCQAPNHSTADRSVSVKRGRDRTLIYSHSDPTDQVLDALGLTMADLFDGDTVSYRYGDGRVVTRTPDKRFRQSGDTSGRALYGSDKLPVDTSVPVYVVEGEQDVDTLATVGAVAVSAAMGATNPDKADWTVLRDRPVVAVVDRDQAGEKWAAKIRGALTDVASSVVFVHAAEGKDATDHVVAGHGVDEFAPVPKPAPARGRRRLKIVRGSEVKMKRVRWWEPGLIPYGTLTMLAGKGGEGKSTAAAAWAAEEAQRGGKVLWLHSEEGRDSQILPKLTAAGVTDVDRITFVDVEVTPDDGNEYDDKIRLPEDISMVAEAMSDEGITFVVLDALTSFKPEGANSNSADDVRSFLEPIVRLANERDAVILGIAHLGKDNNREARQAVLGSTAWTDVPRSVLAFARDPETGWGVISDVKGNLTARSRNIEYTLESSSMMIDGEPTEVGRIVFGNDTDRTADDLRSEARHRRENSDTDGDTPGEWLARFLKNGPQPAANGYVVGGEAGFSKDQLKRAVNRVAMSAKVRGEFGGAWWWKLPDQTFPWEESTTTPIHKILHPSVSSQVRRERSALFQEREECEEREGRNYGEGAPFDCALPDEPIDYLPTMLGDEEDAS